MELFEFDEKLKKDINGFLCGVDEAGRGPLAGPVVAAAVVLKEDAKLYIPDVNDSKKFSEKKRNALYKDILNSAVSIGIGSVCAKKIDEINILNATMLAMKQAVEGLKIVPSLILVDGNRVPNVKIKSKCVIKGDCKSASIAAASVVAKVTRDSFMIELGKKYKGYYFENNKGYGTKKHYESITNLGITEEHRKTFLKKFKEKIFKTQNISGIIGEKVCYGWLRANGYNVICRNYKSRFGEIDLIATKNSYIYFVEVKLRGCCCKYSPKEAVDFKKQQKIIKTAIIFNNNNKNNYQPKFVVMEVLRDSLGRFNVNFIDNAFCVEGEYELFNNI